MTKLICKSIKQAKGGFIIVLPVEDPRRGTYEEEVVATSFSEVVEVLRNELEPKEEEDPLGYDYGEAYGSGEKAND